MPLCVSPQEAMPVVLKRDSLDAMGPVVGEELLEEAAALAASASAEQANAKEKANDELRLPTAPPATSAANEAAGNSNSEEAAARGVVERLGESDFELSMTGMLFNRHFMI